VRGIRRLKSLLGFLDAPASRRGLPLVLCAIASLPAVGWLSQPGFFLSHDGDLHRWRLWEYWQVWRTGQIPVQWAPDLSYGLGSPLFAYYSPLSYLLGSAAQAWGLGSADSAKLVFALGLLLSALGAYVLAAEWYGQRPGARYAGWAGLLAGTAYLYSP
jgi:hypothetical protein